jgi:hypothetical protein
MAGGLADLQEPKLKAVSRHIEHCISPTVHRAFLRRNQF